MKKHTVLAFLAFTLFLTNAKSQERQSDATLEETVSWILNYGVVGSTPDFGNGNTTFLNLRLYNDFIVFNYRIDDGRYVVDYDKRILKSKTVYLEAQKKDSYYLLMVSHGQYKNTNFYFFKNNKQKTERLFKAFEHLFYLLNWDVVLKNQLDLENKF